MGPRSDAQLVLVRFSGELSTKARGTRFQFVGRLLRNLKDALEREGIAPHIQTSHDRIFVELPPARAGAAVAALARVFGVQSVSPVEQRTPLRLEEIVAAGEPLFRERVRGRRFAVRARRVGDRRQISVRPRDVEVELGAALLPVSAGVDLGQPEVTVSLELHPSEAYLFAERIPGCGGLPLGVEGHAVALLSGGFDSAVAAWQLQKRGVALDHVFCNLGGRTHELGALRVAKLLADRWSAGSRPRLHAIDFEAVAADLQQRTAVRYWQVLLKRLMLGAAEAVAAECAAAAIVTGEAVGQVSSQTLQNLAVISRASGLPILRPLVAFNKEEILALARRIGSYDLSKVVGEYCALVPRRPATSASLAAVLEQEAALDRSLLERAVAQRRVFDLHELDTDKLGLPGLDVERVPAGAILIDLRSRAEYDSWHPPQALHLGFSEAVRAHPHFERGKTYVVYCEFGLLSAHLAELMRRAGLDAYHFRGGVKALRRSAAFQRG